MVTQRVHELVPEIKGQLSFMEKIRYAKRNSNLWEALRTKIRIPTVSTIATGSLLFRGQKQVGGYYEMRMLLFYKFLGTGMIEHRHD